jgi:hypothetical protein
MIGSLVAAAALVVGAAGIAKVISPAPAARMLTQGWRGLRRMRALPTIVRIGGLAEVAIAAAVIATGARVAAALLAACYLVFTAVALRLVIGRPRTPCGCFGRAGTAVGRTHVAVDAAFLAAALAGTIRPAGPAAGLLDHGAVVATIGAAQVVLLAVLAYLCITALPDLGADRRRLVEAR